MTPRNKIKKRNATEEATSQQTTMMATVSAIENQAVQDFQAQYRMRSMKKPRTKEAIFDAFVLKPCPKLAATPICTQCAKHKTKASNSHR